MDHGQLLQFLCNHSLYLSVEDDNVQIARCEVE